MRNEGLTRIEADPSLTRQVYEAIRRSIIGGQLVPGTLHSVQSLADSLGVSRTPVREALINLAAQGIVRFERNRGVRILQTSDHDLEEIFTLRLLLEVPATRVAVAQFDEVALKALRKEFAAMERAAASGDEQQMMSRDRLFHRVILEMSGNRRLASFVDRLRDLVLVRGVSTTRASRTLTDIVEEHRTILEAIDARDPEAATSAMKHHVAHTGELILLQESGLQESGLSLGLAPWIELLADL